MWLVKRTGLTWALVALLVALSTHLTGATTTRAFQCGGWSIVPSPNPNNQSSGLSGVVALSANDAWAVGGSGTQTLIEQWNGSSWQVVASPPGGENLNGIAALSASNLWAVGFANQVSQTLIEHWDGSQWSILPSPSRGNYLNILESVAAVSASDIWAVGFDVMGSGLPYRTLMEHWDGKQWRIVKSPNVSSYDNYLYSVAALSSTDVWAVGVYNGRRHGIVAYPLVEHWDGSRWRLVHAPGPDPSSLTGVSAVQANEVWVTGTSGGVSLFEHWNGQQWQRVKSPNTNGPIYAWTDVAAASATDVWMVGSDLYGFSPWQTLTEHWDGTQWRIMPSPNMQDAAGQPALDNYLSGVANVPSTHTFWAVGYYQPHDSYTGNTLIEYYC